MKKHHNPVKLAIQEASVKWPEGSKKVQSQLDYSFNVIPQFIPMEAYKPTGFWEKTAYELSLFMTLISNILKELQKDA